MLKRSKSKKLQFLRRFRKDGQGATAIEFAILGIPFAALLFGIVEISVLFFITSTTEHAVTSVARKIRTGEFQVADGTEAGFKAAVCAAMAGVGNCNRLRVDVVTAGTGKFTDLVLPVSPPVCDPNDDVCKENPPAMPPDNYNDSGSGDVVIVRVQYVHQLAVPSALTGLANSSGNTHVISIATAFRNEPF
ncbi:MAG TPA: pilus assembly protein [Hellea balneolensis]|uniref:Pilus assembly protein n=1 Tax=Hellea balneolensis TaxID=287478 RepID=A0A7C5R065_9PROT|nr:pilus assembly protein [Hellea balneolensis]